MHEFMRGMGADGMTKISSIKSRPKHRSSLFSQVQIDLIMKKQMPNYVHIRFRENISVPKIQFP